MQQQMQQQQQQQQHQQMMMATAKPNNKLGMNPNGPGGPTGPYGQQQQPGMPPLKGIPSPFGTGPGPGPGMMSPNPGGGPPPDFNHMGGWNPVIFHAQSLNTLFFLKIYFYFSKSLNTLKVDY